MYVATRFTGASPARLRRATEPVLWLQPIKLPLPSTARPFVPGSGSATDTVPSLATLSTRALGASDDCPIVPPVPPPAAPPAPFLPAPPAIPPRPPSPG